MQVAKSFLSCLLKLGRSNILLKIYCFEDFKNHSKNVAKLHLQSKSNLHISSLLVKQLDHIKGCGSHNMYGLYGWRTRKHDKMSLLEMKI